MQVSDRRCECFEATYVHPRAELSVAREQPSRGVLNAPALNLLSAVRTAGHRPRLSEATEDSVGVSRPSTGASQLRPRDCCGRSGLDDAFFGADRCKSLRHFLIPRADFAWNNRVHAISSAAKPGIPVPLGHAGGYASALSPSAAEP